MPKTAFPMFHLSSLHLQHALFEHGHVFVGVPPLYKVTISCVHPGTVRRLQM